MDISDYERDTRSLYQWRIINLINNKKHLKLTNKTNRMKMK